MGSLPLIDVAPLSDASPARREAVAEGSGGVRQRRLLLLVGHGVRPETLMTLEAASRAFFALPPAEKARIAMSEGGARGEAGSRSAAS
jgi:isopenicillin N synthase-like dioxygenase